ncbi:MAG: hypothetical protein KDG57_14830 [Rhodoferax sp.]|nr:hypothetical protein [Rhodoferax sp.]
MILDSLVRRLACACACALSVATTGANAASFDLLLTPTDDGRTLLSFSASGTTEGAGAGSDLTWSNLIGGNPFDDALQFFRVDVDPIETFSGISFIGLTLDSDGGAASGQDDLTLRFDGLVSSDDLLTAGPATRRLELDFALLTPGEYTRLTTAGELTLTILASPVPQPPSAALMLAGLGGLGGLSRLWGVRRRRRSGAPSASSGQ